MNDAEILRKARALIEDPAHWTQGSYAKDARGWSVEPTSPKARRWCAIGALRKVTADTSGSGAYSILDRAAMKLDLPHLAEANDTSGHSAVLRIYGRAIQLAEQGEQ